MSEYKKYDLTKQTVEAVFSESLQGYSPVFRTPSGLSIAALWNKDAFSITTELPVSSPLKIKLFDHIVEAASNTSVNIPIDKAGIALCGYDQLLPLTVSDSNETLFDGYLRLCRLEKIYSPTPAENGEMFGALQISAALNPEMDPDKTDLGIACEDGGKLIKVFDRYNTSSPNYPHTSVIASIKDVKELTETDTDISVNMNIKFSAFPKMNYQTVNGRDGAYGLSFILNLGEKCKSLFFGIQRAPQFFYLFTNYGNGSSNNVTLPIRIGEAFDLSVRWTTSQRILVYFNGIKLGDFPYADTFREKYHQNALTFKWSRCRYIANNHEDSFDAEIRDLTVSKNTTPDGIKFGIEDLMGGAAPRAVEDGVYEAPTSLTLPSTLESPDLNGKTALLYDISDKEILSEDGVFTAPQGNGKIVDLKVTGLYGDYVAFEKKYRFFKMGIYTDGRVMIVRNDRDPFTGRARLEDTALYLSEGMNSAVYDCGKVTRLNRVTVNTVTDDIGFINKLHLGLFVSNDNESYEYVKDFSILRSGKALLFYGFDTEARYIKVHFTSNGYKNGVGNILGSLQDMMTACYTASPILSEGGFEKSVSVAIAPAKETEYDRIISFTLNELGINKSELREDMGDVRFYLGDRPLPAYLANDLFHVRIPVLPTNGEPKLTVLYKNPSALPAYDGNEVFEVQYGMRYVLYNPDGTWINSIATLPNGDLLKMVHRNLGDGNYCLASKRSTDGGLTWSAYHNLRGTHTINHAGGFIVDEKNGKVFFFGEHIIFRDREKAILPECKYHIFLSEDNGYTWSGPVHPTGNSLPVPEYAISYSNGITLSTEDGAGPNVDYVFTTGVCRDRVTSAYCTSSIYSRDGGKTWVFSDSRINYNFGNSDAFEGGMSEETVFEQKDGTVVFFARCQINEITHFAYSRSFDGGVTWSELEEGNSLSNIYTTNTQPIIEKLDGTPVFMWGGNHSIGGITYLRYPLNFAYSEDDGITYKGIMDGSVQSIMETYVRTEGRMLHTNPDLTFGTYRGEDMAYMVSTRHQMQVTGFKDYLYKTKGAFDSFENGIDEEGWYSTIAPAPMTTTTIGATDGRFALRIKNCCAIRPIHAIEKGYISFDLYLSDAGDGFDFELQTAFNDTMGVTAPLRLHVGNDGALGTYSASGELIPMGAALSKGQNSLKIVFDAQNDIFALELCGKTYDLPTAGNFGGYLSYAAFFLENTADISIDRFIAYKGQ